MSYQVSDKIKKQTTKCSYDFMCLDNKSWDTCAIKRDIQRTILEIKTQNNQAGCSYRFSYGDSFFFCSCPTRGEIYRRKKI
jgi:hypothetical protein